MFGGDPGPPEVLGQRRQPARLRHAGRALEAGDLSGVHGPSKWTGSGPSDESRSDERYSPMRRRR